MVWLSHHRMDRLRVGTLIAGSLTLSFLVMRYGSRFPDLFCVIAAVASVLAAGLAGAIWGSDHRRHHRASDKAAPAEQMPAVNCSDEASLSAGLSDVGRLTQSIAHDLKSPLVTAQGFLQLVRADLSQGAQDAVLEHLEAISRAVGMMELRLDKLLQVARSGELNGSWTHLDVVDLIQPALDAVAALVRKRAARIETAPSFPNLHGDRERLISVYQNLIENALKYVPDTRTPEIELNWRKAGTEIVYFVRDNGAGIDPAMHQRAFTVFETLGVKKSGSGIGLSIVQRAIDAHRGRVWIESEGEATGTTVCFCIPVHPASTASSDGSAAE
ncbi:MAG: HAMP domain-containing sensor histidine kinase [Planctomycetaceae bacterium]